MPKRKDAPINRLRRLLAEIGMTIPDLAKAVGRSEISLRQAINGRPDLRHHRAAINGFFGVAFFPNDAVPRPEFVGLRLSAKTKLTLPPGAATSIFADLFPASTVFTGNEIEFPDGITLFLPKPKKETAKTTAEK